MTDILKGDPSLIEFMLNPAKYAEGRLLAHNHYGPLITKRYDAVLDFDVNDSALSSPYVPTTSGFFLWFPNDAVLRVWRFSTIPSGNTLLNTSTRGLDCLLAFPIAHPPQPYAVATFTFTADTPIPYSSASDIEYGIIQPRQQVAPTSLSGDFLNVRTLAGMASLRGDSYAAYADPNSSTGGAGSTFNAFCAVGNFPNVWDILQTPHSDDKEDPIQCVDPDDVSQYSFPADDGIYNVPVSDGVCTLVGPDIPVNLQPSVTESTDPVLPGNVQAIPGVGFFNGDVTGYYSPINSEQVLLHAMWITPWQCTYSESLQSNPPGSGGGGLLPNPTKVQLQNVQTTGGMDPTGVLDIDIMFTPSPNTDGGTTPAVTYFVQACHIFMACFSSGKVDTDCYSETIPVSIVDQTSAFASSGYGYAPNLMGYANLRPSRYHVGVPFTVGAQNSTNDYLNATIPIPSGYMYLGSQAFIYCLTNGSGGNPKVYGLNQVGITTQARSFYAPGKIGPARVLSYYGLSNGSSLNFRATVHAEGTPTGTVVPSARRGNGNGSYFSTREDLGKLARLFNRDGTPWHRCYNFRKYSVDGRMPPTPDQLEKYDRVGIRIPILLSEEEDLSAVNNDNKGALIRTSVALTNTDKMIQKLAGKRGREAEKKQMYRPQEGALNPVTGLPEVMPATTWNPYTPPPMKRSREFIDALRPADRPESWWSTPEGIAQQARDDQEDQAYPPVLNPQNPQPPQSVISAPYTYAPEASEWNPYK
jgi:hypothetical protein